MEAPLIRIITAASKNDTKPLEELIHSQESLKIDVNTLNCLKTIVCQKSKGLNGIKCVLSCLKYFCEQRLDQNNWNSLAKKTVEICVDCFNRWAAFYKMDVQEESVLVNMMEIFSKLTEQSDFIVKAFHYSMIQPLIKIITEADFSFKVKCTLVKTLSDILRCSNEDNHCEINPHFQEEIINLSNWIFVCGDFETQATILEALVYIRNHAEDPFKFCAKWFDSYPQIKTDFLNQEFHDFEPMSRVFLNSVNKLNKNHLVYSLGCICAFSNGVELVKPNDLNYSDFWVDFNVSSENVLIHNEDNDGFWERLTLHKENILEVCSNIGEFNLNCQMIQIVKLYFALSSNSVDSSVDLHKYVEIWFEITEDFRRLENSFLTPIYGFRYQCNWKASSSNYLLSNEVLSSETIRSQNTSLSLRKYPPLPVIITPRKFSQNSKSLISDEKCTPDSSLCIHSNQRNEFQSRHQIESTELLDSDDTSFDEIMPTPTSAKENISERKLTNKEKKNFRPNKNDDSSSINNPKKVTEDKEKKTITQPVLIKSPKIHNDQDGTKQIFDSSSKKNRVELNRDSVKRRKLFSPLGNEEDNLNSPLYETSEDNPNPVTEKRQTVMPKVSYSYRTSKEFESKSFVDSDLQVTTDHIEPTSNKLSMKLSRTQKENKSYFNKHDSSDKALNIAVTPTLHGKQKSVYSESISSAEILKSVKKTYTKKNFKKRQRKVKFALRIGSSDSDSDYVPRKSIQTVNSSSKKMKTRKRSYLSTLENKVDPLRLRDSKQAAGDLHLFTPEIPENKTNEQKDIGDIMVFSQFDNTKKNLATENVFFDPKDISDSNVNVPVVSKRLLKNKKSLKKVQLNSATESTTKLSKKQLENVQMPLINYEQNEDVLKSMEICSNLDDAAISTNDTEIKMQSSQPSTSGNSKTKKKSHSRETDLSKFGQFILRNVLKKMEKTKTTLQTERQALYTTMFSHLDEQKNNNLAILVKLEECIKALKKTNNETEKIRQNLTESILKLETKQTDLFANDLKDLKSEMIEIIEVYVKEK